MGFFGGFLGGKNMQGNEPGNGGGITPPVVIPPVEQKNVELLERICFFYGYPKQIDNSTTIEEAATKFAHYDLVIWGENIEDSTHGAHNDAKLILARMKELNPDIKLFGYIPIGITSTRSNLPMSEIASRMDKWKTFGAAGIFLDEYGYDYSVTRQRQNDCIQNARDRGLNVFANSWHQDYVFSNKSIPLAWMNNFDGNPNQIPAIIGENDYTLFENMLYPYGERVVSGNREFFQEVDSLERVNSMLGFSQTSRVEFGGKSYYEHYKTKGVGLDAIVNRNDKMFKEAYLLAVACKIHGYAASIGGWASKKGPYPTYDAPLFNVASIEDVSAPVVESYKGIPGAKITTKVGDKTIRVVFTREDDDFPYDSPPEGVILSINIVGEESNSGETWKRPVGVPVGFQYYDTDLEEMVVHKGNDVWGSLLNREMVIEVRVDDPENPTVGRMWIREDL